MGDEEEERELREGLERARRMAQARAAAAAAKQEVKKEEGAEEEGRGGCCNAVCAACVLQLPAAMCTQ